jgi:hypothetical protein
VPAPPEGELAPPLGAAPVPGVVGGAALAAPLVPVAPVGAVAAGVVALAVVLELELVVLTAA